MMITKIVIKWKEPANAIVVFLIKFILLPHQRLARQPGIFVMQKNQDDGDRYDDAHYCKLRPGGM